MEPSRRRLLATGGATLATLLAGCSSAPGEGGPGTSGGSDTPTTGGYTSTGPRIDDWQLDHEAFYGDTSSGGGGGSATPTSTPMATMAESGGVGAAAGGAKSVANFRRNLREGYLPLPTDLSYEGLFYDYYFDTSGPACGGTFCPRYGTAIAADPLSGATERYLRIGLDSGLDSVPRKPLNLVVVLDVSGSMDAQFDEYYYDDSGERKTVTDHSGRTKIDVAAEAVAAMTTHLRPEDRFGMVVFNDDAAVAKPVRAVGETDMDAIRAHVRELRADGGTNVGAGLETATELLAEYDDQDRTRRETRSIVVTDAMPNVGTTDDDDLQDLLADNADRHHYATFLGVGVDFNAEIVDAITAVEGANYYPVRSADEFETRLTDEFEYMVTPIVFDLSVTLDAAGGGVRTVYGTTAAEDATTEVMHANTLFPSPQREGRTKGGIILAQLAGAGDDLELVAEWETRDGSRNEATAEVRFPDAAPDYFGGTAVRKAVLLSRYADLLKNWLVYERDRDAVDAEGGVDPAPGEDELGRWERQSVDLTVSERYRDRIGRFADHFESEMRAVGDDSLEQELEVLRTLADYEG